MKLSQSPNYYHEVLKRIPPQATPAFEDEDMQIRVWGRRWGVFDDVGPLKAVLVHRPGKEMRVMSADKYDPTIEAFIDDEEQWYFRDKNPPDIGKMQAEHDQMTAALRTDGVEVVNVGGASRDPKAIFTRDNGIAVRGGAIISRMGPVGKDPGTGRRGEEAYVMRKLVEIGMPILRTIHGTGLFEGGSFAFVDEQTAVIGMSYRQNEEAARQVEEVLTFQGVRLVRVPLTGHSLHIDGCFVMVDRKLALVNITKLPYWFLDLLKERGVHTVEVHYGDDPRVNNCLAVRPGKVLLAVNNGQATAERLVQAGVEVVPIDWTECQKNGGGVHCATMPLVRDRR
jgi:N-dimethylarginine dimethylaminohydrolase